jgi:uncharacterized protein YjbI with pentapeptide repeats
MEVLYRVEIISFITSDDSDEKVEAQAKSALEEKIRYLYNIKGGLIKGYLRAGNKDLSDIMIGGIILKDFDFEGVNLVGTSFRPSYGEVFGSLDGCDFSKAKFSENVGEILAPKKKGMLRYTCFNNTSLKGTNFSGNDLTNCRFNSSLFENTNLLGVVINNLDKDLWPFCNASMGGNTMVTAGMAFDNIILSSVDVPDTKNYRYINYVNGKDALKAFTQDSLKASCGAFMMLKLAFRGDDKLSAFSLFPKELLRAFAENTMPKPVVGYVKAMEYKRDELAKVRVIE